MADTIFDNTLAGTQRLIQGTTGIQTFTNSGTDTSYSIGPGDPNDYYRFTVSRSSNVIVKLNPQGGNLSLAVLDASGNPILGTANNNPNGMADAVVSDEIDPLQPGQNYYIRVSGTPAADVNYSLTVETNPRSRADILWRGLTGGGGNGIWRMDGTQFISSQSTGIPVDPIWQLSRVADFNGDGTTDYLWHQPTSATVGIWLMDANNDQILSSVSLPSVGSDWFIAAAADFDGNGTPDIIWQNIFGGYTGAWIMNGPNYVSGVTVDTLSSGGWFIEAADDFTGDGKPDLFFRNFLTGENVIWQMNGFSFSASASVDSRPISWRMQGTGDFDGNGSPDLLWRDYATGDTDVWFMNGTTSIGSAYIGNVDPTAYQVSGVIKDVPTVDLAGNSAAAAFNLGKLEGTATYRDNIGASDTRDYYAFTVDFPTKVSISGKGTNIPTLANFEIVAADGVTVLGSAVANGANETRLTELTLETGTYYVRVSSLTAAKTAYTLDITGDRIGSNLLFPTAPPPITTFRLLDNTVFTAANPVSVQTPFTFNLDYAATYTGGNLNQFQVGFYLSVDNTLDATDLSLGTTTITGTAPDTRINRTQQLTLPSFDNPFWSSRGTNNAYNIIIKLDPNDQIQEIDRATGQPAENDNVFATPITIQPFRPDLVPINFDVTQTASTRGGVVNLSGAVANNGTARTDAGRITGRTFAVQFFLSRDTVLSQGNADASLNDIQLSTNPSPFTFAPFNAGTSVNLNNGNSFTATLPTTWAGYSAQQPGNVYYVLMVADPTRQTAEGDIPAYLTNNVVSEAITIPFT